MIRKTKIEGVFKIFGHRFEDERGIIKGVYKWIDIDKWSEFRALEVTCTRSYSNVLRGLHAQGWNRIVYPVNGKILNVLVDIRKESETFGTVEKFVIDGKHRYGIYIPYYVANGYVVLGNEPVDYFYFLDQYYDEKYTRGVLWNDPYLKIDWQVRNPIVSIKDKKNKTFKEVIKELYD